MSVEISSGPFGCCVLLRHLIQLKIVVVLPSVIELLRKLCRSHLIIEHRIEATSASLKIISFLSMCLGIFVHTQMTFQAKTTFFWDVQQSHSSVNCVAFYTICTQGFFFFF